MEAVGDNAQAVLRLDGVTVRYGSFVAVDGLDLQLERGELFGLLGPNGAGKSTTLRVVIGQLTPTTGRVLLLGHDIARDWDLVKPRFGYVPDRDNHFEELTGRQNLEFFAELYRAPHSRVAEDLSRVELDEAADLPVKGYSLGMRRKLLLARALLHRPEVLYLDEPTANLDVHSTAIVHEVLGDLSKQGVSVLLTSHDMEEVEKLCNRVAVLRGGRRVALGRPAELRREHARRLVDVVSTDGDRLVCDLDSHDDRVTLATLVTHGKVASVSSRAADFRAAFLELTGGERE